MPADPLAVQDIRLSNALFHAVAVPDVMLLGSAVSPQRDSIPSLVGNFKHKHAVIMKDFFGLGRVGKLKVWVVQGSRDVGKQEMMQSTYHKSEAVSHRIFAAQEAKRRHAAAAENEFHQVTIGLIDEAMWDLNSRGRRSC